MSCGAVLPAVWEGADCLSCCRAIAVLPARTQLTAMSGCGVPLLEAANMEIITLKSSPCVSDFPTSAEHVCIALQHYSALCMRVRHRSKCCMLAICLVMPYYLSDNCTGTVPTDQGTFGNCQPCSWSHIEREFASTAAGLNSATFEQSWHADGCDLKHQDNLTDPEQLPVSYSRGPPTPFTSGEVRLHDMGSHTTALWASVLVVFLAK